MASPKTKPKFIAIAFIEANTSSWWKAPKQTSAKPKPFLAAGRFTNSESTPPPLPQLTQTLPPEPQPPADNPPSLELLRAAKLQPEMRSPQIPWLKQTKSMIFWREPEGRLRPSAGVWGRLPPRIGSQ